MIRVGFVLVCDEGWLGGINYFKNLLNAIHSLPDRKIEPVIITGRNADPTLRNNFHDVEIVQTGLVEFRNIRWIVRQGYKYLFSYDRFLEELLIQNDISVLSHSGCIGANAKIPTIGWIPDFQHLRLPEFFSKKEVEFRNKELSKLCQLCSCVLLSSYSAQKDLADFAPSSISKSKVLQFVAGLSEVTNIPGIESLEKRYEFSGPYFHLPNQFWAHKNHRVVIDALRILKSNGRKALVLATGNPHDRRQPDYFDSLIDYAKECDVLDCFKVLGVVPYTDLVALMQNSISLINPSLFEGWSTTVEEAKSTGKRIILSDISVHREQDPRGGVFFDPGNPNELAKAIWSLSSSRDYDAERKLAEMAREALPERRNKFAKEFEGIVLSLVG